MEMKMIGVSIESFTMEKNTILHADILDIIFDGRNKDYGAYQLRKTYNSRMGAALVITAALLAFLFAGYLFAGSSAKSRPDAIDEPVTLIEIEPEPIVEAVVPPPPAKPEIPKVESTQFTAPLIMHDNEVKDDEKPPLVDDLENTRIAIINSDGVKDDQIITAPIDDKSKGIIDAPRKNEIEDTKPFTRVEIESSYPGGAGAWMRYLNKTFRYPQQAQDDGIQGTVLVQFIVDKEGNVSNVEAISGPATNGLREEAVRVIMKSGKWDPAIQNGRKVSSYKKQPITFRLEAE